MNFIFKIIKQGLLGAMRTTLSAKKPPQQLFPDIITPYLS